MSRPGDFSPKTIEHLAASAGYRCARCSRQTSFYDPADGKRKGLGRAAHIVAASPGGPRADSTYTIEQLKSAHNGVHLCANCADVVDKFPGSYPVSTLINLQNEAQISALNPVISTGTIMPISRERAICINNFIQNAQRAINSINIWQNIEMRYFQCQWDRVSAESAIAFYGKCNNIENLINEFNGGDYQTVKIQISIKNNILYIYQRITRDPWFLNTEGSMYSYTLPSNYIPIEQRSFIANSWNEVAALLLDTHSLLETLNNRLYPQQ